MCHTPSCDIAEINNGSSVLAMVSPTEQSIEAMLYQHVTTAVVTLNIAVQKQLQSKVN